VPISFQACLEQITFQALHSEKNTSSSTDRSKWWNFFNISGFVEEFEITDASSLQYNKHFDIIFVNMILLPLNVR